MREKCVSLILMCCPRLTVCFVMIAAAVTDLLAVTYPHGPSASGVIDVTSLPSSLTSAGFSSLDNTGATDNRVRLQALVDRFKQEGTTNSGLDHRILFFPDGTYRLSGGIAGVTNTPGGGGILLQGQSRDGTILKLADNASGFGSAGSPQQLLSFFEGTWTNNAFYNGVENLTIDVGSGNPGAIAVAFISNNTGYLRNLRIRTGGGGSAPGHTGLLLNSDSGIGNPSGVGLIKDLEVLGFDYAIDAGDASQQGYALEGLTLSGQMVSGIRVSNPPIWIRKLTSTNSVPAIVQSGAGSHVVVLNSDFNGGSASRAAIERSGGHLFVRDVTQSGYRAIIEDGLIDVTTDLSDDEYLSDGSTVLKLWESTPGRTLDLPIVETPLVPWDADAVDWAFVDPTVQDDDTAAFQTALNSGASTICVLPDSNSSVKISSTLTIGPNVRRIIGQWNGIQPAGYLFHADPGEPIFKFADSNHPAVMIEKFRSDFLADRQSYFIRHESASDLVLRDIFYVAGPLYRNEPGVDGRLFIEDVHCLPGGQAVDFDNTPVAIRIERQTAYMRQVNPEQFSNGIVNDGGTLWIFGFKVGEAAGPVVRSINNATTEILGGVMNNTHDIAPADPGSTRILDIERSNVSAVLLERFEGVGTGGGLSWGKNFYTAVETRGTETRMLENSTAAGVPRRPGQQGAMVALYVGYQFGATVGAAADRYSEGDGQVEAFVVSRGSEDTSSPVTISYTVGGDAVPGTDYIALPGSVTIEAGQSEAVVPVALLDNELPDLPRTLSLTLQPGVGYSLGQVFSRSIEMIDNDNVSADTQIALPPEDSTTRTVTLRNPTGAPQTVTVVMPSSDNYEYRSSNEVGGPEFDWTDISGLGTKVLDNADDAFATNVSIGFPFSYYGDTYSTLAINSNGFISFASDLTGQGSDWQNRDLRGTGGWPAMVAPFWEDLNPASAGSDAIYYHPADADTFIVQWNNLRPYGNNQDINRVTFQLILKRNGAIIFQYLQMNSEEDIYSYTTGLKNLDETRSLLISLRSSVSSDSDFNVDFLHPLMAIRINPLASWISANTTEVVVPAGGSATVDLSFNSSGLDSQQVATDILFVYPDPAIGTVSLPVAMDVANGQVPTASSVAVLGTPEAGQTLTASYVFNDPDGDPEGATLIEWLEGASASGPFSVVATGPSYPVTAASAGRTIRARVTPVSVNAPTTGAAVESASVGPVPGSLPPIGEPPTAASVVILGTPESGEMLTASYVFDDLDGDAEGATQTDWLRSPTPGGTYSVVGSGSGYTLSETDVGAYIKVRITPVSVSAPTTGSPAESAAVGPVAGPPLPSGLAAYWPFDDGRDPATDASGNARHAALQSGSSLLPEGRYGDALEVTSAGGAQADNAHFVTGDFTIAAWVRHDGPYTTTTNEIILSKGWDFYLAIDTSAADGKLRLQFKHSGGTVSNAHLNNAKTLIPPDTWTHVAAVRSGSSFAFYINGVSYGPNFTTGPTIAAPDSNAVALTVGANPLSTTAWWRGRLDEVQLYTRALNSSEIASVVGFQPDVLAAWRSGAFASLPGGANDADAVNLANPDGDPYANLLEFAFRLDPLGDNGTDSLPFLGTHSVGLDDYPTLSYVRRRGLGTGSTETGYHIDGITYTVERSTTLQAGSWETGVAVLEEVSVADNGDGTEIVTVRSLTPLGTVDGEFLRLKITE